MRILLVNSTDAVGGAALMAYNLHRTYRSAGIESFMVVGRNIRGEPFINEIPSDASTIYTGPLHRMADRWSAGGWLSKATRFIATPRLYVDAALGLDHNGYPGTRRILDVFGVPSIIHGHNLHGGYFDLRLLPVLSRAVPFVLTLHDTWLSTGHCAQSLDCERWRTGCGECPYLNIYPAVKRDATAFNWRRKKNVFAHSRLYLTAPSQWMMDRIKSSILADGGLVGSRVIPNGIDTEVFRPGDRSLARDQLSLPRDGLIIGLPAGVLEDDYWKDSTTFIEAIRSVTATLGTEGITLLGIGSNGRPAAASDIKIRNVPYTNDPSKVALCYQAADIYVHPARADTFPTMILESMACATPVVGTAVGGIPEQIGSGGSSCGLLAKQGDGEGLGKAICTLLQNPRLRLELGDVGSRVAVERYCLRTQAKAYLSWYREIIEDWTQRNWDSD